MTVRSIAAVPTENGSRYLQQICKHWSHNMAVEFSAEKGVVVFPAEGRSGNWPSDARLTMTVEPATLRCEIEGAVPEQVDVLKDVVAQHLDRFAFKEGSLSFAWQDQYT